MQEGGSAKDLRKPSLNVIRPFLYIIDCLSYRSYHSIRDSFDSFDSLICDWLWWHVIAHVKKILDWIDSFYSNLPYSIDSSIFLNSDRDQRVSFSVVVLVVFGASYSYLSFEFNSSIPQAHSRRHHYHHQIPHRKSHHRQIFILAYTYTRER